MWVCVCVCTMYMCVGVRMCVCVLFAPALRASQMPFTPHMPAAAAAHRLAALASTGVCLAGGNLHLIHTVAPQQGDFQIHNWGAWEHKLRRLSPEQKMVRGAMDTGMQGGTAKPCAVCAAQS